MGDLTRFQPTESETVKAIYAWHEKRNAEAEANRVSKGRIGASVLGQECDRRVWYRFRQCSASTFDGRLLRLFATGHLEEPRMVEELRGIGCEVVAEIDGQQIECNDLGGHLGGFIDGMVHGLPEAPATWHVLECKTHNAKSFAGLGQSGVRASKPDHWVQMQIYMGLNKVSRALYLAKNKDTDELYGERVRYDSEAFQALRARARRIIESTQPPERIANRPDDFRCRFCEAKPLCWWTGDSALPLPAITCRTCCHATPEIRDGTDAPWSCAKHKRDLAAAEQKTACEKHLLIPGLMRAHDPVDAGDDWIDFENKGQKWRHGAGGVSSWEIAGLPPMASVPFGEDLIPTRLIDCYPPDSSRHALTGTDLGKLTVLVSNMLDKDPDDWPEPTRKDETDTYRAYEYEGRILIVFDLTSAEENKYTVYEGVE